MELLNAAASYYSNSAVITLFIAPAAFCAIAYFLFNRRDEITLLAVRNTAATIVVVGLNAAAFWLFVDEVNLYLQHFYDSLGIPTLPADIWQPVPFPLLCLMALIAKDFADYWNHRLMHTTWLWPTHAAHHSDTHVNAFTSFRVHFLEAIVMGISYLIILTWLQMPTAVPVVYLVTHLHNLYVHTNLPIRHGPFKLLVASPAFHRWHHADVKAAHGKNIANVMPLWDALFGTYYDDRLCDAPMGGLKSGIHDTDPLQIFIYPFRQWGRLIRDRIGAPLRRRAAHRNARARETNGLA